MNANTKTPLQDSGYSTCVPSITDNIEDINIRLQDFDEQPIRQILLERGGHNVRIVEIEDTDDGGRGASLQIVSNLTLNEIAKLSDKIVPVLWDALPPPEATIALVANPNIGVANRFFHGKEQIYVPLPNCEQLRASSEERKSEFFTSLVRSPPPNFNSAYLLPPTQPQLLWMQDYHDPQYRGQAILPRYGAILQHPVARQHNQHQGVRNYNNSPAARLLKSSPDHHTVVFRQIWTKVLLPQQWHLYYDEGIAGYKGNDMFYDNAKVRFHCPICLNGWTTMKGRILFHMQFFGTHGAASYYAFKQKCASCLKKYANNPMMAGKIQFSYPAWYPEETDKVVSNLVARIRHRFYGGPKQPVRKVLKRPGNPRSEHVKVTCEACQLNVC